MNEFTCALLAGGVAGTSVDTVLFPLDTIKTRLQSKEGFFKSGGFKNIYAGLSSAVLGSAPSAALFFVTYDGIKFYCRNWENKSTGHIIAASTGEIVACAVRVPTEVVKQRLQVGHFGSFKEAYSDIIRSNGIKGFYQGFSMTIFREIPFSSIQFPLYERLKIWYAQSAKRKVTSIESGACGMVAGGIAAALTTPLDVMKTRIMLANKSGTRLSIIGSFKEIRGQGYKVFFSGVGPRVVWISIGGSIFLGVYDAVQKVLIKSDN